jgi:chemotaxis protein MotA
MDPATLIGILVAFVIVTVANVLEGGNPMSLMLVAPLLLVFGGTLAICVAGGTMADTKLSMKAMVRAFTSPAPSGAKLVPELVTLADKARREGLLALEDSVADIDDPFLVRALTMAIDGTDPEELRDILEAEVQAKKAETK